MKTKNKLSTREAAEALGVCVQRIQAKIKQGHFPHAGLCECGRSVLIPAKDIKLNKTRK